MYLKQGDIFWGTSRAFNKEIMEVTDKKSFPAGVKLFQEGQKATDFYILIKGAVSIRIGETGDTVYTVSHAGEAFGWSSLIERETYSASAECTAPSTLLVVDRDRFAPILEKYPMDGQIFYKKLAGTLGHRLLRSYKVVASTSKSALSVSYGTGQVMETTVEH